MHIGGQQFLILFAGSAVVYIDVNGVEIGVHSPGHACRSGYQVLRLGIRADQHCDPFANRPALADILLHHVRFEATVHLFSHLTEG